MLLLLIFFSSCNGQGDTVPELDANIRSILQDKNGNYWFGSDDEGVYRYDGKTLRLFTYKDGLPGNQVRTIQEDQSGNIWFVTGNGICRYDGKSFTKFMEPKDFTAGLPYSKGQQTETEELLFEAGAGVYRYTGNSFSDLRLPPATQYKQDSSSHINPYAVYCTLKDKSGRIWFGTQSLGVCCYDGKSFTWFTEMGLSGPAVRALFEDKDGNLWFGNNGSGLFRYDGKTLTNVTEENGLSHPDLYTARPGTLSRVWTINEDSSGDLWIGSISEGVWRHDGKNFRNYTVKDGLPGNAINTIYKDKKGELLFGTVNDGVYKFNGKSFTKFTSN